MPDAVLRLHPQLRQKPGRSGDPLVRASADPSHDRGIVEVGMGHPSLVRKPDHIHHVVGRPGNLPVDLHQAVRRVARHDAEDDDGCGVERLLSIVGHAYSVWQGRNAHISSGPVGGDWPELGPEDLIVVPGYRAGTTLATPPSGGGGIDRRSARGNLSEVVPPSRWWTTER